MTPLRERRVIRMQKTEKINIIVTLITCLLCVGLFSFLHEYAQSKAKYIGVTKVGFILTGDESTPYSENFIRAIEGLEREFGTDVSVYTMYNVPFEDADEMIEELAASDVKIIFADSEGYAEAMKEGASKHPGIQFCQATADNANSSPSYENYHTFMGWIYQGRYVAGKMAGLKMQELIDNGVIGENDAKIGYVGAFSCPEVVSGYTAFFLGARSVCPTAHMVVGYTETWTSYVAEKEMAEQFINEGCVIIAQHSDTIGPAIACEEAAVYKPVYHVGYNQDMVSIAPTTSIIGTKIDWTNYIVGAVDAIRKEKRIEDVVDAETNGNDAGAGFERGWVAMFELNMAVAAPGSEEVLEDTIEDFRKERCHVFYGDFTGVNPENPDDTVNLNNEFYENNKTSYPTFYYILDDVIEVRN